MDIVSYINCNGTSLELQDSGARTQIQQWQDTAVGLNEKAGQATQSIARIDSSIAILDASVSLLDASMAALDASFKALDLSSDRKIAAIATSLTATNAKIAEAGSSLSSDAVARNNEYDDFVDTDFSVPDAIGQIQFDKVNVYSPISGDSFAGEATTSNIILSDNTLNVLTADAHVCISGTTSSSQLLIDGGGHKVNLYTTVADTAISGGKAVASFGTAVASFGHCATFIDQDFNKHTIARTEPWESDRYILDSDKNVIKRSTEEEKNKTYRGETVYIPIDNAWPSAAGFTVADNAYINWTGWFYSFNNLVDDVVQIGDDWYAQITFSDAGTYKIDGDRYMTGNTPNVIMFNCFRNAGDVHICADGTVELPASVETAYIAQEAQVGKLYMRGVNGVCGSMRSVDIESPVIHVESCVLDGFYRLYQTCGTTGGWQTVKNTEIKNETGGAVWGCYNINNTSIRCYQHVCGCYIHDTGYSRDGTQAVRLGQRFHIHDNTIVDNGYASILGGVNWKISDNIENYPMGCVERNTLGQTDEYFRNAYKYVVSDTGCVHIMTSTNGIVIRRNVINRFTGRGLCRGIFGDDGCTSIYVYENIIRQVQGYSIDIRYATGRDVPSEMLYNGHRMVAANIVDSAIRCQGIPDQADTCDVKAFSNLELVTTNAVQTSDSYTNATVCEDNVISTGAIMADCTVYTGSRYSAICYIDTPFKSHTYNMVPMP